MDDFLIDGRTLTDRLNDALAADDPQVQPGTQLHDDIPVCVLDFDLLQEVERLLPAPLTGGDDGRVRLLICPECADPGCGSLTAIVDTLGETVIWRDFVIEDDLEPRFHHVVLPDLGPFAFERQAYTTALRAFIEQWPARSDTRDRQATEEERRAAIVRAQLRSDSRRRWRARWLFRRGSGRDPLVETVTIDPDWVN